MSDVGEMAWKTKRICCLRVRQGVNLLVTLPILFNIPIVNLAKYLLRFGSDSIIFGWFSSDPLKKCISKLRQGSGGTYFITAQFLIAKLRNQRAKLSLQLKMKSQGDDRHHCTICNGCLGEHEQEIADS